MSEEKKIKIKYWILSDLVIIVDVIASIVIKDVSCCLSILLSVFMILFGKALFIYNEFEKKIDEINDMTREEIIDFSEIKSQLDRIKARYNEERSILLKSDLEYTSNNVLDIIDYIIHED